MDMDGDAMKKFGIILLVIGEIFYWSIVLDPLLGMGIMLSILGTTILVIKALTKDDKIE